MLESGERKKAHAPPIKKLVLFDRAVCVCACSHSPPLALATCELLYSFIASRILDFSGGNRTKDRFPSSLCVRRGAYRMSKSGCCLRHATLCGHAMHGAWSPLRAGTHVEMVRRLACASRAGASVRKGPSEKNAIRGTFFTGAHHLGVLWQRSRSSISRPSSFDHASLFCSVF